MMNTKLLFVYGTLKRDFDNQVARYLHRTQSFVGEGKMHGTLVRISFYPGAVYDPESTKTVKGDVFEIVHHPDQLFRLLDEYEGIGDHSAEAAEFERRSIPIEINGETKQAQCYIFTGNSEDYPLIPSGEFNPESY